MNRAVNAILDPTASGLGERQSTASMFRYHSVARSGSAAYAATSSRGRAISISLTTSTANPRIVSRPNWPTPERLDVSCVAGAFLAGACYRAAGSERQASRAMAQAIAQLVTAAARQP